jgi:hypothetical protein
VARLIDRLIGTPAARAAHRDAKDDLAEITDPETPDYLAANDAVVTAEQHLPKWRRKWRRYNR